MSQELTGTPPELAAIANATINKLIPAKSQKVYECAYEKFIKWAQEYKVYNYTENVMLAYFSNLAENLKSSTLWAQYSMLKAMLNMKHNINIEKYTKVIAYLKRQNEGYKPKKSKVFTKEQVNNFLHNSPDNIYLAAKVLLIFGVAGACRCDELMHINLNDIEDLENVILIKIPNSKTKKSRSFTIVGDFYINIYRKYAALRPKDTNFTRFFIRYQNGQCHKVVMGIHKISNICKDIANYLKLPNPTEYTGHCLRRTSATFLVDNGGDITSLKRHGGWKSTNVAEGYIEESITNKTQTAVKILTPDNYNLPSTSTVNNNSTSGDIQNIDLNNSPARSILENKIVTVDTATASSGLNLQNCSIQNCTFNINVTNK